jgi:integrase
MPRLVHKAPAYTLHKPSNRARVRYGGKEYWLPGLYNSPESHRAYADLLERLKDPDPPATPNRPAPPALHLITVAELIERFWAHAKRYYRKGGKPTGEHVTIRAALRPLLRLHGRMVAAQFRPSHLKQVREEMIRLDWSRRYINDSVRRIKTMFAWATEEELVSAEVSGALKMVKALQEGRSEAREKPEVGPVPDAIVDRTLARISPLFADLIRLMRLSGMRPGEALALVDTDIDRADPDCWEYRPGSHKSQHRGRKRVVYLGPKCQAILSPWILKAGGGRIFPVTASGFRTAINRACDRAGVERWAPNMLRHTAATDIRRRFGAEGAQVILGHAHVKTTEIYAEVDAERGRAVARAVG